MNSSPKRESAARRLQKPFTWCLVLGAATLVGCATQTRLGYLIPAHQLSQQAKDEITLIHFVPSEDKREVGGGAVVAFAAEIALDFVKKEIEREAAQYEAKFGKTLHLSTDDMGRGVNKVYLSRWVKNKPLHFGDSQPSDDYRLAVEDFFNALTNVISGTSNQSEIVRAQMKDRALAFLLELDINKLANSGPYRMQPRSLWVYKSKAKVVDFNWKEGWKIWQWLGALAFKTDSTARYQIDVNVKALSRAKDSLVPVLVDVSPSGPLIADHNHELDSRGKAYRFGDPNGAYFDIPGYGRDTNAANAKGYCTITLTVTESDASNVRQHLKKAADEIEGNKKSWLDSLKN